MKKSMVSLAVLLMVVFLVGCLDYKAYDIPQEEEQAEDTSDEDLLAEIAAIEEQLQLEEEKEGVDVIEETPEEGAVEELPAVEEIVEEPAAEEVTEEIILPELTEEVEEELVGAMPIITVKENEPVRLKVNVTDPDEDPVTHTFSKPLDKDGMWKTNYGDAGDYIITISATDGKLTTKQKVKIVVERVNVPPVIGLVKDIVVDEGETVKFIPEVSDPNKDEVTVTVSEPLKSGLFETDHTSSGEYMITVEATDGELEAEKKFKLTVNDINVLPVVSNLADIIINEGDIVRIEPRVSDLDGDEITIRISNPVGDDGVWETRYTDHGDYKIVITADDGKDKVTEEIKLVVKDVNMPPEIIDIHMG